MNNTSYADIKNLIKEKAKVPRLEKMEEILAEYFANKQSNSKKHLCRFFLKGRCLFDGSKCHFSHGIDDLIFEKPDLEQNMQKIKDIYKKEEVKDPKDLTKNLDELNGKKTKGSKQPSLHLGVSYKNLFEFQPRMMQMNELEEMHTQEEIDNDPKLKGVVRNAFHSDLQQKLLHFFFNLYDVKFLPKDFLELCYVKAGWNAKFRKIINNHCCYEVDHPEYGPVLLRLPRTADFEVLVEECLVKLFKDHNLFEQIPVKSSLISDLYKNDLMAKDIFLPPITSFVYRQKMQLDDFLQDFQTKESFLKRLSEALQISEEELRSKKLFEHEKEESFQSREELIEAYHLKEVVDGKSQLCRFFMRGICLFDAKACKFAHEIDDLIWKELDIEECDEQKLSKEEKALAEALKLTQSGLNLEYTFKVLKEAQPSLNLEWNFKVLHDYQQKLFEKGILKELAEVERINKDDEVRNEIWFQMHVDLTKQFIDFLFKKYDRPYLKKTFIEKCYQSIGWKTNWTRILDGEFCYEVQVPKVGSVILKVPTLEELDTLMEDSIVKIIKDNNLLENLPISATTISKYFYKDLVPANPTMPTLQMFLKRKNLTIDDYLQMLQNQESFRAKLQKEYPEKPDLSKMVLFDSATTELNNLMAKMKKILLELLEKSNIGFILFSRFEEAISKKCTKEITRFSNNNTFFKKVMRGVAMTAGVLVINLMSEVYLFSLKKFKGADDETIYKKYITKLNTKCKKKNLSEIHVLDKPLFTEEFISSLDAKEDEIEAGKIKVVDNEKSLVEAREAIDKCNTLAVDLEGNLSKGGMIELIQIGTGDLIFIFDVYKINKAETHEFYVRMMTYLKEVMENPGICKVFHDCRKDSLALHLFAHTCPVNVFDVSAAHTLIQHLEIYSSFKDLIIPLVADVQETKIENVLTFEKGLEMLIYLDEIKPPGLNEVLKAYGASHGINHLKAVMKKKFEEMPRGYFLKRPLDKEYLVYSAKDVEDLIEVKQNIEIRILQILDKMINIDDDRGKLLVDLLWRKVSKTYVLFGCVNTTANSS